MIIIILKKGWKFVSPFPVVMIGAWDKKKVLFSNLEAFIPVEFTNVFLSYNPLQVITKWPVMIFVSFITFPQTLEFKWVLLLTAWLFKHKNFVGFCIYLVFEVGPSLKPLFTFLEKILGGHLGQIQPFLFLKVFNLLQVNKYIDQAKL